jgi:hypothetical protein
MNANSVGSVRSFLNLDLSSFSKSSHTVFEDRILTFVRFGISQMPEGKSHSSLIA